MKMKMIDVIVKLANEKIEDQTVLEIYDSNHKVNTYTFNGETKTFYNEYMNLYFFKLDDKFLNFDVKLIPPKPKKYLVKFNMRGLRNGREYLNLDYDKRGGRVHLNDKCETLSIQTEFTKDELQSIKPVREFLEDMESKYELIEVTDDESVDS